MATGAKVPGPFSQFEFSLQFRAEVNYLALLIYTSQHLSLEHPKGKLVSSHKSNRGNLGYIN